MQRGNSQDITKYYLTAEQIARFHADGFLRLPKMLSLDELKEFEVSYNQLIENKVPGVDRDYSDVDGAVKPVEDYTSISVLLPSKYSEAIRESIFRLRAAHVTEQLYGTGMGYDYDRAIAKLGLKNKVKDNTFHWHQDLLYCGQHGDLVSFPEDTRAATFSLAIDATTPENGCLSYLPGSHKGEKIRTHVPVDPNSKIKTAFMITKTHITPEEEKHIVQVPLEPGDAVVHGDFTLHTSSANKTENMRRTYLMCLRAQAALDLAKSKGRQRSLNAHAPITVQ